MRPRLSFLFMAIIAALTFCGVAADCGVAAERPNIVLILADDIGIEGLGSYGGVSYRTPNLDRLAQEGVRFTHAYSQPLCAPTRVQLMTGKYNHRNWRSFGILDPQETTLGHHMTAAGYATGIFGKWQLQSYEPPDFPGAAKRRGTGMHPQDAGFQEYALFHALHTEDKGSRYANPTMLEGTAGPTGELKTYTGRYGADVWVEKILDFMGRHRQQPVFVYYPMALPHFPFQPTPNSPGWNPDKPQETDNRYAADMIEYMDTAVGNLMQGLREKNLHENTIVMFYSDNGTHREVFSEMRDGRTIQGGKGTPTQTGIHVPLIVHSPGRFTPAVCDDIIDASDILPTLMELAGAPLSDDIPCDGISFVPSLLGREGPRREAAFFWYDPRPGWDKERYGRFVFALNLRYKLFRSGRLFRLTERPLEAIPVDPLHMTAEDRQAKAELGAVIGRMLADVDEPPLVNAYGEPELDLLPVPADRDARDRMVEALLATGEEVIYGDPSIAEHRLWIFNPLDIEDDELRPCVVFIHGGGWAGKPSMLAPQCVYLKRRGVNTVSIHFRAPRGDLTPAGTLRDARAAYRWIVEHGHEHHIDANRLVVSGGSAGGHLALALSTIALSDDPVIEHQPQGYVLFNPVIDLVDGWRAGRERCESKGIDPESFSPAHHVRRGLPPVLVLSGSDDKLIPPALLASFEASMTAAGNRCDVVIYPQAGHGFFNYGLEGNRHFQQTMWQFEAFLKSLGIPVGLF